MGVVHVLQFLNPTRRLFKNMTKKEKSLQRIYFHHLSDHESTVTYHCVQSGHHDPINRIMFETCTNGIMTSSESSVTSVVCISMSEKQNPYIWKIREGVKCFAFNAPLQLVVTGGSDGAVRLWARYVTTHPVATLLGHHAAVIDVAIYQPVEQIFSYSKDAELRIWDITTHECLKIVLLNFPCLHDPQIPEHGNFPFLLLSPPLPDEIPPHLLVGCKDYLALLPLSVRQRAGREGVLTDQLGDAGSKASLSCALYNPTLQQVVTGSTDSTVCVWDLETGKKKLHISNAHGEEALSCMALESSQRRLITGARNGTIKVWNLLNGLNLHKLQPLTNSMVTGLLCLHGDRLFAVGWSQCFVEYDLASSKDLHVKANRSWKTSGPHKSDILALGHCPALGVIATATQKGEAVVWKLETQMPVLRLCKDTSMGGAPPVDCLIFLQHRAADRSLRNKGVLVSSQAGFVCFWSVTGQTHSYGQFFAPEQSEECVLTLSSNQSENTLLVCGDTAGWLHIWDISNYGLDIPEQTLSTRPPLLHRWRTHTGALRSVNVLKVDERLFILSASADGAARLWTQDGDHVGSFGQGAQWNITDPCSFQPKRNTECILTKERCDQLQSRRPDSCDSGQTSQGALSAEGPRLGN
ncbi:cilia- and flagella-associated protein 337-like [Eucyclogobius newberryi]|uniref:cilia- and flagella-associated protein 337-like n=1 Tax=Eucyclogobius newberryi TaxID=166745 RepID=UPI003B5BC6EA